MDRREARLSEAHKIAASAAALDAVSLEAEKQYRAALVAPARGERRTAHPIESDLARKALTDLELALVQAPVNGSLDGAARRFATAAEALLLRSREPARVSPDGGLQPTASLQALLATHQLFRDAEAHLRVEVEKTVRSSSLLEAMRRTRDPRDRSEGDVFSRVK